MNEMYVIAKTLRKETAFSFAENKLQNLRIVDNYVEFMKQCYSGKENPTIEECEENAFRTFISEYSKMCDIYSGWLKNGRVFILDKRDKFILALYKVDDISHSAISHYNPLKFDCIEQSVSNKQFFKELGKRFDMSTDEYSLVEQCNQLIHEQIINQ